ncbi:hypothetical protein EVAR_5451_1 [Eumeta japonica]|uniref:Uncharacterized protein n=1 Tax=Eumeta variegata TaxID=151549 RepID=A0A4C1TC32_EUMVA|nr:hypothetical protein EVAR_5451_1 [Eumeta japonica]
MESRIASGAGTEVEKGTRVENECGINSVIGLESEMIPELRLTSIDIAGKIIIMRPCWCSCGHRLYGRVAHKKVQNNACRAS